MIRSCLVIVVPVAVFVVTACKQAPSPAGGSSTATTVTPPSDAGTGFATPPVDATGLGASSSAPADAAPPTSAGCPRSLDAPRRREHCTLGERCQVPDGVCFCDGYHGGIPPQPGVDYTHWVCGRKRNRTDGCPDDVHTDARCQQAGQRCGELQGLFCGPMYECRGHLWKYVVDDCNTIP